MIQFLELLFYKAWADLRAESERTYVGFLWWFVDPVVNMALLYVVFSRLLDRAVEDYVPFLLVGTVVWKWFQSGLTASADSIRAHAGLIGQVDIPKVFFPLVMVLETTAKFTIAFVLLLGFLWLYGLPVSAHYAALPLVLGVQALLIVGLGLCIASVVPFVPDLSVLLENGLRMLFFLSGVFFPISHLPAGLRGLFELNPMVPLLEAFRDVLMYQRWPDFGALGAVALASLLLTTAGAAVLHRFDRVYPRSLG